MIVTDNKPVAMDKLTESITYLAILDINICLVNIGEKEGYDHNVTSLIW